MSSDWKNQLKEAKKTLSPFLTNKLKNSDPREANTYTRVNPTLDLRNALKPEIDKLIEHLQKVEKWFNHYLKAENISLTVSTQAIQNAITYGGQSEKYAFIQTWRKYGHEPGFLYESNVKNFVDVLKHVLTNGRSINAIGGAQAGKTNFESVWMLLGPAVLVITNAAVLSGEAEKPLLYFPIISGPPHKNLGRQSQHAIANLFRMYGRMKFQTPDSTSLSGTSALNYFKQFLEIEPSYYEENTLDRSLGENVLIDLPNKFVRRATQKSMDDLRSFIQDRVIYGLNCDSLPRKERDLFRFEFLLIVDEAHHGAMDDEEKGNVSLFSKLMKSRLIYDGEEQTFADIVSNPNTLSRVILASATNWLAENERLAENFTEVRLPLGDDYHGPNVFNCDYIDKTKRPTKPYYGQLSELADKAQQPFFKYFSPRAYDNMESFREIRDGIPCKCPRSSLGSLTATHTPGCWAALSHAEYREMSNKTLAEVIRWMAIKGGDISGDIVIRFCNDNSLTKSIANNVQPYLPDVDLKAWTGDRAGTAKEFILEHKKASSKPIAVLVTGRARMGDDFPKIAHFVEFATKITTLNALDQGLCGRACGYGKFWKPVPSDYKPQPGIAMRIKEGRTEIGVGNRVWLTDAEADNANLHVDSLANPIITGRKPHPAVKMDGFKKSHLKAFAGIGYALNDPKLNVWLDEADRMVSHMLRHDKRDEQGKMLYRPENFSAIGVVEKNRTRYIPLFAKFDPASYTNSRQDLSRKIMGVDNLHIYGPADVNAGIMEIPYDLDPGTGLVRASFEWDKLITSVVIQDNDPGKYGSKDTHTVALIYSPRGSRAGRAGRVGEPGVSGRGVQFRELMIKVVRVDHEGVIQSEFRSQDRWKVVGVVFHCEKPVATSITVRPEINPHKGVTKQFMATAGGDE
jgi:hypothetical protein